MEIKLNHIYRAKNPRKVTQLFRHFFNDREVIYISQNRQVVQYDSPSLKNGSKYPKVSMEKFLKWAGSDVTDITPKNEWCNYG